MFINDDLMICYSYCICYQSDNKVIIGYITLLLLSLYFIIIIIIIIIIIKILLWRYSVSQYIRERNRFDQIFVSEVTCQGIR